MSAPLAGGSSSLVAIVFGEAFAPAAPLFAWLILGGGGAILLSLVAAELVARGKYFLPLRIVFPMLGASLAAQILMIPTLGALGAAFSIGFCSLVAGLCAMLWLTPAEVRPSPYMVLISALSGGIGFGVAYLFPPDGLPLADVVVGVGVTFAALTGTRVFKRAEFISLLRSLLPRRGASL
jgi:O-antigen/teichoic acid export membrane protein